MAVLTGDETAFCAGANLKDLPRPAPSGPLGPTRLQLSKPVIAAIEGWCVAGGLELAAWCDLRVAGRSARFGCLERRWGVPLIDGGTYRLPRIVGLGRALDLILTGREFDAAEAERIGFVDRVVADGAALDAAVALAEAIVASRGVRGQRPSVGLRRPRPRRGRGARQRGPPGRTRSSPRASPTASPGSPAPPADVPRPGAARSDEGRPGRGDTARAGALPPRR